MSDSCRLIIDAPASGAWNMGVDEVLLDLAAQDGHSTLRFYAWSEPTLSLGFFQDISHRDRHASSRHCGVVRRASGGGAIVHDHELTYSLAMPESHRWCRDRLATYTLVHRAIVGVLARVGLSAGLFGCDDACTIAPPENALPSPTVEASAGMIGCASLPESSPSAFLCFQRRTRGDVVALGMKVAGSAQRRIAGAVLQHGSILVRRSACAPELPGIMDLVESSRSHEGDVAQSASRPALTSSTLTSGVPQRSNASGSDENLRDELVAAMKVCLETEYFEAPLDDAERRRVEEVVARKFGAADWTVRRGRTSGSTTPAGPAGGGMLDR